MDVVALVSGGKDSCYTLLKCRQHKHNIVALAHILPPHDGEPDSHMYQSVGSSVIPALAEALDLPLQTHRTSARAVNKQLAYTPTADDEVEDLVLLLQDVKRKHPTIRAVCAGALWSDYQRLRVEYAASKVGLLSLAYLWRREQAPLLDEMIQSGVHAILVKVAGVGLREEHLGKTLPEMRGTLLKLGEKFGSHVCGEGGEFESLVLWMPGMQKRIVLDETEVVQHVSDPVAPVAYLKVKNWHLEQLTLEQKEWEMPVLPTPPDVLAEVDVYSKTTPPAVVPSVSSAELQKFAQEENTTVGIGSSFMHVVVRVAHRGGEGVRRAAKRLQDVLSENGEALGSVVYVILQLGAVSGAHYMEANKGYVDLFGTAECTPPPSRACVGSYGSNPGTVVEALVRRGGKKGWTMHVQSLSEWAPPCIGPYAQLVEEEGVVFVCGVLPLYAVTAEIPDGLDAGKQTRVCGYNIKRTLEGGGWSLERLGAFVAYVTRPEFVIQVEREMEEFLPERSLKVVVPVAELPKGGSVEIRCLGSADKEGLYKLECGTDEQLPKLKVEAVVCGKLGIVTLTYKSVEDFDYAHVVGIGLGQAPLEPHTTPLSLQVYAHESDSRNAQQALSSAFPRTAVCVTYSAWLPHDNSLVCIAMFDLSYN